MTSPVEPHASEEPDNDVHVIDIEFDIENIIDNVIEQADDVSAHKIQVDEIPTDTVILMNGNGTNIPDSKPKSVNVAEVVQKVRDAYNRGVTRPIKWRRQQLKNLLRMYEENMDGLIEALRKDLRRCKMEAVLLELDILLNDLRHTLYNLDDWCKPERPKKDIVNMLDDVVLYNEPYGVTLIIGAWNYPILLLLLPATGAIAAGNAIIFKPSELSVACTSFLAEYLPKYLDPEAIALIEGGPEETAELLKQKFDYIFYTGGTNVGRVVYEAATKHLTPVTLELGGKSPVYIDNTVDIAITAKRLLWGKFINAGQTCIAPDYVLCSKEVQDKLIEACKKTLKEWYGEDPQKSPDYCRIINNRHFSRLQALIDASKDKIAIGGRYDSADKYIEPTLVANVTASDRVMQEEIFGPILPIVTIENTYEAIKFINDRDHPLVIYVFSNQKNIQKLFNKQTRSGSISMNDTVMFFAVDSLPFGGIGNSGMGAYHGKLTFDTFTHKKGCLKKNFFSVGEKLAAARYPPYSDKKLNFLQLLVRKRHFPSLKFVPYLLVFLLGAGLSYGICSWQKTRSEDL